MDTEDERTQKVVEAIKKYHEAMKQRTESMEQSGKENGSSIIIQKSNMSQSARQDQISFVAPIELTTGASYRGKYD